MKRRPAVDAFGGVRRLAPNDGVAPHENSSERIKNPHDDREFVIFPAEN
jgi:hypothetical protein